MDLNQIGGPIVLFLLMTVVGLELTVDDFRRVLKTPRAVVGGTLGQWVLLPLMTWGLVWVFDLSPAFAAGAVLLAVSPGAGISNILASIAKANTALSVSLTATASVFAVVTLPTIASLTIGRFLGDGVLIEVPVFNLVIQLFISLLLPITLGMWIRHGSEARAQRIAPWLQRATMVAVGFVLVVALATAPEEQRSFDGASLGLVAAAAWTLAAMAIGWTLGHLLRLDSADRFTLLIEFSARNLAVATIVALSGLGRVDLTFFSGFYFATGYPLAAAAAFLHRRSAQTRTR